MVLNCEGTLELQCCVRHTLRADVGASALPSVQAATQVATEPDVLVESARCPRRNYRDLTADVAVNRDDLYEMRPMCRVPALSFLDFSWSQKLQKFGEREAGLLDNAAYR
jgi:hypothetical protein